MFNLASDENQTRIPITVAIVLATLLLALALSVTAVFQVLDEYRMLGDWLARPGPVPVGGDPSVAAGHRRADHRPVDAPRRSSCSARWRPSGSSSASSPSGGRLHQVKLLAHDILASMDQGVITTDRRRSSRASTRPRSTCSGSTPTASAGRSPASRRPRCRWRS